MTIGVDIEEISRFKNKSDKFLSRIFTPLELEYCLNCSKPESHLAVRFCAKEAVIKSLTPLGINIAEYNKIEIYHDKNNCPNVRILKNIGANLNIDLSLSHDKSKAIAFVTVKKFD